MSRATEVMYQQLLNYYMKLREHKDKSYLSMFQEVSSIHMDYAARISQLEQELSTARDQSLRARSQCTVAEEQVQKYNEEVQEMGRKLAETQLQCGKLLEYTHCCT